MASRRTRVKYNPKTRNLPGTNLALLARALQLIARREARFQQHLQAESQPCGGLTFNPANNLWSQTTSTASSTTSRDNISSKSTSSNTTSTSTSTTPASTPRPEKRKLSPSIYQQELARKKRQRLFRETPSSSLSSTRSPTPEITTSASPISLLISPTTDMERWVAKEAQIAKLGSQARHNAYHGNTRPDTEIPLPVVQAKRKISAVDDEPPYIPPKTVDPPPLQSRKRRVNGSSSVAIKDKSRPVVDKSFGPVVLTKEQLAAEKERCHFCQLETFSTHTEYPVSVENVMEDGSRFPADFKFIEKPKFGTGVERCGPEFRLGCNCESPAECMGGKCACHNPDDEKNMPYHTKGPSKGCLKRGYLNSPLAIFECHDACLSCNGDCPKRVVDNGRKIPLTIFRTTDGRGWGVKSTVDIKAGQFIDKYIGEILTSKAANHRRKKADRAERKDIYLFALDKFKETDDEAVYEVDGEFYGGPTRFINHSCDPNLRIFARVGDESDKHIHDLAFFAIKDIHKGEEFTFDYVDQQAEDVRFDGLSEKEKAAMQHDMARCLCGSKNCRGWLW